MRLISSSTSTVDLSSSVSVFSYTNSGKTSLIQLCLDIGGDSTNQLNTAEQVLTIKFERESRYYESCEYTVPATELKASKDVSPIVLGAGDEVEVFMESDNVSDTSVEVTVEAYGINEQEVLDNVTVIAKNTQ